MKANPSGAGRAYVRTVLFVLVILFAVGLAGHALPAAMPLMLFLSPWFLLVTGVLVVVPSVAAGGWRLVLWVLGAYAFTFLVEAVGVASGAIFGEYVYGPTLGWAWLGVPLIIAFNWVMVVNGAVCLAGQIVPVRAGWLRAPAILLVTGAIATVFDFILEPVAVRLDYWTWAGGAIPLQNYLAWFVLATLVALGRPRRVPSACELGPPGRLAGAYVVMQAVYFIALRLMWHFGAA